jgi:hypothetical protein
MTPVYNEAKNSPCSLRFQFAAEGGWDAGGALAGKQALICSDDQNGACITTPYRPRNVAPLLDANFQIKMGLRVEGY